MVKTINIIQVAVLCYLFVAAVLSCPRSCVLLFCMSLLQDCFPSTVSSPGVVAFFGCMY